MTIAEIKNNPNLLKCMDPEYLADFADDTEVVFEVYAFSYDPEWHLLDASPCLANFTNPNEAIEQTKKLTLENTFIAVPGAYVVLEVETVVENTDEEFLNLGTIYTKNFF
jgi:lactam utilization protein B